MSLSDSHSRSISARAIFAGALKHLPDFMFADIVNVNVRETSVCVKIKPESHIGRFRARLRGMSGFWTRELVK